MASSNSGRPPAAATRPITGGAAWSRVVVVLPMLVSTLVAQTAHWTAFLVTLGLYGAWTLAFLAWRLGTATWSFLLPAAIDIGAITVLSLFAGGPASEIGYAYILVPFTAVASYRPWLTALAGTASALAYLALVPLALDPADIERLDPDRGAPYDLLRAFGFAGYLVWFGVVCTVVAALLVRRERRIADLVGVQERLVADLIGAEERERAALADALHDSAVQSLMAARLELSDAPVPLEERTRVLDLLDTTVAELRQAVFDLHPRVLLELGIAAAVETLSERSAERGGFAVGFHAAVTAEHPAEAMLYSVARELLANVVRHSRARNVRVELREERGRLGLTVTDDGVGFPPSILAERLTGGHVGLASHRVRVEGAGGSFTLRTSEGGGTEVEVWLPG
ncbi:ATP-binding protein [Amycolatopsis sp. NBC_01307]|uniref:sensor histidine kinase n=1 Tax=Amycolatopsis sp. NBC_01307 TaxID=2903561 RepID=UPI002E111AE3|nr:ATP-binding protein [Amycolatopsis sp. NBC_01307]